MEKYCANCEYLLEGCPNICNAFHTPTDIFEETECSDYRQKNFVEQDRRNRDVRSKVRKTSIIDKFIDNYNVGGRTLSAITDNTQPINNRFDGYFLENNFDRAKPIETPKVLLSADIILDTIYSQTDNIIYRLNVQPRYVLVGNQIIRILRGYFCERAIMRNEAISQSLTIFDLQILHIPTLPDDYIQVVAPIQP